MEDGTGVSHCVIMVFIPTIGKEVPLQKPECYRWELVYEEIRNLLMETDVLGELHRIEDSMALMMKILLGDHLFEVELPPLQTRSMKKKAMSGVQKDQHPLGGPTDQYEEPRGQPLIATQTSYAPS
jgi:hypothetical protein